MNYRGLRRWIWPWLIVTLVCSAGLAGALYGIILTLTLGVSAAASGTVGVAVIGGAACTLLLGYIGSFWGLMRAKSATVSAFEAKPLPASHGLVELTKVLAGSIGLPPPEVYVYPSDDINAWATGSSAKDAAIGLSQGAVDRLDGSMLAGIIAHELGHIASGDMVRMQFAISFQNAVVLMAWAVGLQRQARISFGIIGEIGVKWLSRRREYWADAVGAVLTSPATMTEVLRELESERTRSAHKNRHHLLFHWDRAWFFLWTREWLLRSHPSVTQRCRAIENGYFIASVTQRLGRSVPSRAAPLKPVQVPARPMDDELDIELYEPPPLPRYQFGFWNRWSDEALAAMMFVVGVPIGAVGFHILEPKPTPSNPAQVAGWQRSVEAPTRPSVGEPLAKTTPPPARVASVETPIPVAPRPAPMPTPKRVYPKEPRYEPDDAGGDGDLTPYQALVEAGTSCFYRANHTVDNTMATHLEDAGPDNSDLLVFTLPQNDSSAITKLHLIRTQATSCWKKNGGVQHETVTMRELNQSYNVWVLTDAKSGATAECGIWPAPRKTSKGPLAMAAYCR